MDDSIPVATNDTCKTCLTTISMTRSPTSDGKSCVRTYWCRCGMWTYREDLAIRISEA